MSDGFDSDCFSDSESWLRDFGSPSPFSVSSGGDADSLSGRARRRSYPHFQPRLEDSSDAVSLESLGSGGSDVSSSKDSGTSLSVSDDRLVTDHSDAGLVRSDRESPSDDSGSFARSGSDGVSRDVPSRATVLDGRSLSDPVPSSVRSLDPLSAGLPARAPRPGSAGPTRGVRRRREHREPAVVSDVGSDDGYDVGRVPRRPADGRGGAVRTGRGTTAVGPRRARWVFTWNNPLPDVFGRFADDDGFFDGRYVGTEEFTGAISDLARDFEIRYRDSECSWLVGQPELSASGTLHVQGLVVFPTPRTLEGVKRALSLRTVHLEPMRGTLAQAFEYCTKEDTRVGAGFEFGERPDLSIRPGSRVDIRAATDALVNAPGLPEEELSRLILEGDSAVAKYGRHFREVVSLLQEQRVRERAASFRLDPTLKKVYVLWGPPRTGKTTAAMSYVEFEFRDMTIVRPSGGSSGTKWWPSNPNTEVLILDEFDPSDWSLGFLDALLDVHPCDVQPKGSMCTVLYGTVFVISNLDPRGWFITSPRSLIDAFWSRVKLVVYVPPPTDGFPTLNQLLATGAAPRALGLLN